VQKRNILRNRVDFPVLKDIILLFSYLLPDRFKIDFFLVSKTTLV